MIWSAAGSLAAADYQITVKLQDFSNPDGSPVDLKQGISVQTVLGKLIPGDIWFMHRATLPTGGSVKEDVQIEKTEARVSYSLGEEKEGKISVTIAINVTKVVNVKDGVSIKSTRSVDTIVNCPIGQEICMGGVQQEGKKINLFTISVAK